MFVKICGMRRRGDIDLAVTCGADAVGFIYAPSPRQVTPEHVARLVDGLHVLKVGVFVDENLERIRDIREKNRLDIIQLHGNETPEYCEKLGGRLFKALRAKNRTTVDRMADFPPDIKILLDAYVKGQAGGTGRRIDKNLLDQIKDFSGIILAGGVGPDNAAELIEQYQPFGIDVNSKVEVEPGMKDHGKMKALFRSLDRFI